MRWNDPQPTFGFLVHDVSRLMRKRFDRRAREIGLTKSQWMVLAHLARHEGIKQRGLAEILEVEPITLARHVHRLQQAGWVEQREDPADRRLRRLFLAAKARPVLDRMGAVADVTREEALSGLSPPERERLHRLLLRVKANLSACNAARGPGEDAATRAAKGVASA